MANTIFKVADEFALGARETLTNKTVQELISRMKRGILKPGSKLPSQNELVEQLGVSRTGIREALQILAALNLIEIRAGLGCYVKSVSSEYIVNADVLSILLEKEAILEVIEARKIMEAETSALAAQRGKDADFWLMEDAVNRIEKAVQRGESVADPAAEVHVAVAKATHNFVLYKLVRSFNHLMGKAGILVESTVDDPDGFKEHEFTSHRELCQIIRRGDPEEARTAMVSHIAASEALIVRAFQAAEMQEEQVSL